MLEDTFEFLKDSLGESTNDALAIPPPSSADNANSVSSGNAVHLWLRIFELSSQQKITDLDPSFTRFESKLQEPTELIDVAAGQLKTNSVRHLSPNQTMDLSLLLTFTGTLKTRLDSSLIQQICAILAWTLHPQYAAIWKQKATT